MAAPAAELAPTIVGAWPVLEAPRALGSQVAVAREGLLLGQAVAQARGVPAEAELEAARVQAPVGLALAGLQERPGPAP